MDSYVSQVDGIIDAIRKNPGITRSELVDLRVNGFRIANVTARISQARQRLQKNFETIKCTELKQISIGKTRIRRTTYMITNL